MKSISDRKDWLQQVVGPVHSLLKLNATPVIETKPRLANPAVEEKVVEDVTDSEFKSEEIYIDKKYPPEVGFLYVTDNAREDYINVILRNAELHAQNIPLQGAPDIAKLIDEKESLENIRGLVARFSTDQEDLRKWLNKFQTRFGDKSTLIIYNSTDCEVPWEMFNISIGSPTAPLGEKYLGALVTTARWQHIIGIPGNITLEITPEECQGSILAYFDPELPGTQQETSALNDLNPTYCKSSKELLNHLSNVEYGHSLVYIACHCNFGKTIQTLTLTDKEELLTYLNLYGLSLPLLRSSKNVVFLNACHSAQSQEFHESYPTKTRVGFAELFLSKGSQAVIGTLGGVADIYAIQIGQALIESVLSHPDIPLATILKELRACISEKIAKNPTDKNLLSEFFNTFMYVYYGNPLLQMRLMRREES